MYLIAVPAAFVLLAIFAIWIVASQVWSGRTVALRRKFPAAVVLSCVNSAQLTNQMRAYSRPDLWPDGPAFFPIAFCLVANADGWGIWTGTKKPRWVSTWAPVTAVRAVTVQQSGRKSSGIELQINSDEHRIRLSIVVIGSGFLNQFPPRLGELEAVTERLDSWRTIQAPRVEEW